MKTHLVQPAATLAATAMQIFAKTGTPVTEELMKKLMVSAYKAVNEAEKEVLSASPRQASTIETF